MSVRHECPPPLAERLLVAALGESDWAESILGDLHEEHAWRAGQSRIRAAAWYWGLALRLGMRGLVNRTRSFRAPHDVPALPSATGDSLMRNLALEARYAVRSIVKRPALSGLVILTLALGLGANAAIFSMFDALVLRPFTMRDVDRVTMVTFMPADDIYRQESVSPANYLDIRKETGAFEHLAAVVFWTPNLVDRSEPESVRGSLVSASFFDVLGVVPASGRTFHPEEEALGHHRRAVISDGLWHRRFASDPSIVGQSINVDGEPYEVVGIAPAGFDFPMGTEVWAPLAFTPEAAANRRARYLTVFGRLAQNRTIDEAKAQMAVVGDRLAREHPDTNQRHEARVYTLGDGMMDIGLMPILSLWQASAGFVLLIACANVASLLLARGAERQREMAIRLAIGANRARVVRELLLESIVLALIAVPVALAVAWVSLKAVVGYMPAKIVKFVAGWNQMDVDWRLVGFTVVLALVTAVVFGLMPAIQASRSRMAETLKDGARGATSGASRLRLRRSLVVGEIALALPLLVAAALSVVTVHRYVNGPQGYDPEGLLTLRVELKDSQYPNEDARRRFADEVIERLRATPGVSHAAAINIIPASASNRNRTIEIDGRPNLDPNNRPDADFRVVTPDAFATLRVPLLSGRGFTEADREGTQPVAIVSQSLADTHWPGEDPIGRRIKVGETWLTVVGIAGNHIHGWFNRRNYPTLYQPLRQAPSSALGFMIRTAGEPTALAASARAAVRAVDPLQPVFDLEPMRTTIHDRTIGLRYVGGIMFVFAALALVLAVVGVYGVMAYMVAQRTHEIGVRMALGATRQDVLRLTVGQTSRLTVIGVAIGLGLSILLGRLIESALFGLTSNDPRLTGGLAAILVLSALAAGYFPARRAASIDPTVALRGE